MKMLTGCENCTELELATSEYIENCFPTCIDCSMVISKETSGRVAQLRCVYKSSVATSTGFLHFNTCRRDSDMLARTKQDDPCGGVL